MNHIKKLSQNIKVIAQINDKNKIPFLKRANADIVLSSDDYTSFMSIANILEPSSAQAINALIDISSNNIEALLQFATVRGIGLTIVGPEQPLVKGIVDSVNQYHKLLNKVRPIINDGGYLISINNALFQSGKAHNDVLSNLCEDGYLRIEDRLSIPEDCVGDSTSFLKQLPTDPSPYNHATKITVLKVKRK